MQNLDRQNLDHKCYMREKKDRKIYKMMGKIWWLKSVMLILVAIKEIEIKSVREKTKSYRWIQVYK